MGTEKEFGYEWDIYTEIIPLHKKQFLGWVTPLQLEDFKGKKVLDAGCGIGRNSVWVLEAGAESVLAFDYDPRTVAVAQDNLKKFPNARVEYQSIYEILQKNVFDVAMCIGVLHHLRDPKKAVAQLVESLKPGGTLVFWVYGLEGNTTFLSWANPLRKVLTSRIHPEITRLLAIGMTALLKIYLTLPHRSEYLRLLKERSFRHMEAMVFDQLLPSIANYWTREEVLDLVAELPVTVDHLTHNNKMSWTLVGTKK